MITADQLERALDATACHRGQVQVFLYCVGGDRSNGIELHVVRDLILPPNMQKVFSYRAHTSEYDKAHAAANTYAERYKLRLITEYINDHA